ncbi:MAG: tRNA (guanosine(46)-N7)-methyltransferase TrmB [Xanthomonadales bacterium]|jgi:tRNA (guanine-N7-)-methyltransferase|nr:tRNA (guanosine(46)-N7)-methyltransferase TrmB [Xanthomonadales bacterium]
MNKRLAIQKDTTTEKARQRTVRSYVLRAGRVTEGQKRALEELWPVYGIEPANQPLDLASLFGNSQPVTMEIGFGNGDATWQMAKASPDRNYLGVEVHKPGVGSLLLRLEENGLENVRIASEDAVEFLEQRIPDGSLEGICIYFPDPWPKKRHHKRRIIQAPFVALMARKIRAGGLLHLATDWAPYAESMLEVMHPELDFENLSPAGDFCPKPEWRPPTKYEKRGQGLGHRVSDLVFRRVDRGA